MNAKTKINFAAAASLLRVGDTGALSINSFAGVQISHSLTSPGLSLRIDGHRHLWFSPHFLRQLKLYR